MGFLRLLADWFRANVPVFGGWIADAIEGIESAIETWLSPVLEFIDNVRKFFEWLWISFEKAGERFAKLVQDFWWFINWLAGTAWNTIYNFFTQGLPQLVDLVNSTARGLQEFFRDPWRVISQAAESIWNFIRSKLDPILKPLADGIEWLKSELSAKARELSNRVDDLRSWGEGEHSRLEGKFSSDIGDLKKDYSDFKNNANLTLNSILRDIEGLSESFGDSVTDLESAKMELEELRKNKPAIVPDVEFKVTDRTPARRMGIVAWLLEKILGSLFELIMWAIAFWAADMVIKWLQGEYDLETGEYRSPVTEFLNFLGLRYDLEKGTIELETTRVVLSPGIFAIAGGVKK